MKTMCDLVPMARYKKVSKKVNSMEVESMEEGEQEGGSVQFIDEVADPNWPNDEEDEDCHDEAVIKIIYDEDIDECANTISDDVIANNSIENDAIIDVEFRKMMLNVTSNPIRLLSELKLYLVDR